MKFHSLIAGALLLLAFEPAAARPDSQAHATVPQGAVVMPAATPAEGTLADTSAAIVYQNGELVVDIRKSAGAGILRSLLAYFSHDRCGAQPDTASAAPAGAAEAQAQPTAMPAEGPLPEPLSLGLLGAGIALLGWTRRQGNWFEKQIFPWPALCWLD